MAFRRVLLRMVLALSVILGSLVPVLCEQSAAAASPGALATASVADSSAVLEALAYLQTKQLADGGIEGWTAGVSDEFTTIKSAIAVASTGRPVGYLTTGGKTPLDYLAAHAIAYTHQTGTALLFPGRAGMLAVAVVAAGGDPRAFGDPAPMDIIAELQATYDAGTGAYSSTASEGYSSGAAGTVNQLWAILGLAAAQEDVPAKAGEYLAGLQESDGGWGYGSGGDVDLTAMAIQALIAGGNVAPGDAVVVRGLDFLRDKQAATGGWQSYGSMSADSTAAAIQGAVAAGYTPVSTTWATPSGGTPLGELLALQAEDGSFSGNALGTAHAISGLVEAPLPVLGRSQAIHLSLTWVGSQQNLDGSWSSAFGDVGATCDAALAFAAAGYDPDTVKASGGTGSAMDYLAANAAAFAVGTSPDKAGKLAVTVRAAGGNPSSFGGVDLVAAINSYYGSSTAGAYGDATNTWYQSFAILGLVAAGQAIPPAAIDTLKGLQQDDGGWKYDLTVADWNFTTADTTGLALQALIAAGVPATDAVITDALAFLRAKQDAGAGWSDANTTAYALQGVLATGADPVVDWSRNGHSPYDALASYRKSDGAFVWTWSYASDNGLAAWQAIAALAGAHYPLVPSGPLAPFAAVASPPDPDRLVSGTPRMQLTGSGIDVTVPFGSDINTDGQVALEYRFDGGAWQALTGTRGDGCFTATIAATRTGQYDLRATFADGDGVQGSALVTATVSRPQWVILLPVTMNVP